MSSDVRCMCAYAPRAWSRALLLRRAAAQPARPCAARSAAAVVISMEFGFPAAELIELLCSVAHCSGVCRSAVCFICVVIMLFHNIINPEIVRSKNTFIYIVLYIV